MAALRLWWGDMEKLASLLKDRIRSLVLAIDGEDASSDHIDQLNELLRTHPHLARYVARHGAASSIGIAGNRLPTTK